MTSEKLERSTYRDPTTPGDPVRSGNPTRAENALDMDQYYRPLERLHGSNLHGWGVASGLSVMATLNSPGVTVLPGVALDSSGRHISLAVDGHAEIGQNADAPGANPTLVPITDTGIILPTAGLSGDKYVTIQFWETFDIDGFQLGAFRYFHTPWLRLLDVASFTSDGSRLVLAKISLGSEANAGQVTALAQDLRQATDLPVGSIHLQKSVRSTPAANAAVTATVEAGAIRAHATDPKTPHDYDGLAITVPNASDEVHLERDDHGNFAKVSLGAEQVVARRGDGAESVRIETANGNLTANGRVTANSLAASTVDASGEVTTNSLAASGTVTAGAIVASGDVTARGNVTASNIAAGDITGTTITTTRNGKIIALDAQGNQTIVLNAGNGNVGIGNTNPQFKLEVTAPNQLGLAVQGPNSGVGAGLQLQSTGPGGRGWELLATGATSAQGGGKFNIRDLGDASDDFTITSGGNVGIGITNPQTKLDVGGSITARGPITASGITVNGNITANGTINGSGDISTNGNINCHDLNVRNPGGPAIVNIDSGVLQCRNCAISADNQGSNVSVVLALLKAGDFFGPVSIHGKFEKPGGSFKIDHPLDPANKYLSHSFVESPDMKNIYDGVVVLDVNGEAVVELPQWFEALNSDFRYQLTCIGGSAPVYIAEKLHDNSFKIAGGKPKMEVSWQVTGIRQDAWANAHRVLVEEEKPPEERDYYLYPELHGAPQERHIRVVHYPEVALQRSSGAEMNEKELSVLNRVAQGEL